jgi:hypothetical protein
MPITYIALANSTERGDILMPITFTDPSNRCHEGGSSSFLTWTWTCVISLLPPPQPSAPPIALPGLRVPGGGGAAVLPDVRGPVGLPHGQEAHQRHRPTAAQHQRHARHTRQRQATADQRRGPQRESHSPPPHPSLSKRNPEVAHACLEGRRLCARSSPYPPAPP